MNGELVIDRQCTATARQEQNGQLSVIQIIDRLAQTPTLTKEAADAIATLVGLQREQEAQHRKEKFFEALRLAQEEMPRVQKNGLIDPKGAKVPYARLEDLDACIRPIYQKHGFTVIFDAPQTVDGAKIRNSAKFSCAGHTETLEITAAPSNRKTGGLQMTNAQSVKQTITECRRHLLEMFFNIITVGADEMHNPDPIDQNKADTIRTRMNDLPQSRPGILLEKLCLKYGVKRPEELTVDKYDSAIEDVENTERLKARG